MRKTLWLGRDDQVLTPFAGDLGVETHGNSWFQTVRNGWWWFGVARDVAGGRYVDSVPQSSNSALIGASK